MTMTKAVAFGASRVLSSVPTRRGDKTARALAAPAVGVVLLLAIWQAVGVFDILGASVPPPTEVLAQLVQRGDLLLRSVGATALRALVGGAVGLALGIALAVLASFFPRAESTLLRVAVLVNALPVIALGPILMTTPARPVIPEVFAALAVLFSTLLAAGDGLRSSAPSSIDVFSVYRASRWTRFLRLQLPSALPMLADALRLGIPAAILGTLLGEWFGIDRGLGVVMVSAMRNVQYGLLWSAALVAAALSLLLYGVASLLERVATRRFGRGSSRPTEVRALSRRAEILTAVGIVVVLLVAWQLWVSVGRVSPLVAPQPTGVLQALVENAGPYLLAALTTFGFAAGGVLAGALIGLVLAVIVSTVPILRAMLSPVLVVIPTIPIVVFIPILGSLLGFGTTTVFASCVLMAFFPIFVLALSGLATRPPGSADLFSVHGASRWQVLTRLALPAALPSLLLAVRLSAASAFLVALSAEWLLGQGGLGRLFSEQRVVLDTSGSWAVVLLAIVLSILTYLGAGALERAVVRRWL